jgi:hypothetical protein
MCVGTLIGIHGLGDLSPLPGSQIASILIYALVCVLAVNEPIKLIFLARRRGTPAQ